MKVRICFEKLFLFKMGCEISGWRFLKFWFFYAVFTVAWKINAKNVAKKVVNGVICSNCERKYHWRCGGITKDDEKAKVMQSNNWECYIF